MNIELNEKLVETVLPNNIVSTDEESPLSARIEPYVDDAVLWLTSELLGGSVELKPEHERLAVRAVILRAFIMALPSLDLVATPSGFGVISSQNMAPASKERVERLIASLGKNLDELLCQLQEACMTYEEWRNSYPGTMFTSSFFCFLRDVIGERTEGADIFSDFMRKRYVFVKMERAVADRFMGRPFMDIVLKKFTSGELTEAHPVIATLRSPAAIRFYPKEYGRRAIPHSAWHVAQSIIAILPDYPELYDMYLAGCPTPQLGHFVNDRKGGYFF